MAHRFNTSFRKSLYPQRSPRKTSPPISLIPEVTFPLPTFLPTFMFTRDFCTLAGPQDRTHLESEIRKAHVICVVYSIDNPNSFDRIPTYWLPHFRQLGVNVKQLTSLLLTDSRVDALPLDRFPSFSSATKLTCVAEKLPMKLWRMRLFLL